MDWFRFYIDTLDKPKIQLLPDRLFKVWVNMLCLARAFGGKLPPLTILAFRLRVDEDVARGYLVELVARRLLDKSGEEYAPHDWEEYQYESDSSTERVRRFRDRKSKKVVDETVGNVSRNGFCSVSVSESVSSFENLTKKQKLEDVEVFLDAKPGTFQGFWVRWLELTQRAQRQADACRAWLSVVTPSLQIDAMACLERYGASDEVSRGIVANPDKWLYQQARDAFKGTWQKRANGKSSGIVGDLERYLDEHPD